MAFSFPFAASSSAIVANELEGHWSLNETDLESLQVLNTAPVADPEHGVRTETMKIGQFSPVGTGYYFDGETNDDYVELGSSFIDALRATNELTISGWINPAFLRPGTNAASRQTIFAANAQLQFSLQAEGHFTYVYWRDEAYVTNLFGEAEAVEAGEFVHVALTHKHDPDGFGDDVLSLYINGELVQEIFPYPTISQFVIDGEMLHLGRYEGNTSRDFDGVMSDFGLWAGRALSHEEIAAIGALGRANVPLSSPDVDAVLELYAVQNGTVQTGDWEWSYTTVFPAPADGSDLGIGKHYYGSDDSIYLVLGGSEGNWQGVTASGGVPFGIPVTFLQEPENVDVEMGGTAVFEVVAEGTGALVYQWYFTSSEGTELIEGATGSTLTIENVDLGDEGTYSCEVQNPAADYVLRTREARLTVIGRPSRLIGHWKLDETNLENLDVYNSAPGAIENGVRTETMLINQQSPLGRAYHFDENNLDSVDIGSSIVGELTDKNTLTISIWINPDYLPPSGTGASSRQVLLAAENQFQLGVQAQGRIIFYFREADAGGYNFLQGIDIPDRVTAGEWNHIGVVRTGAEAAIYLNGVEVLSGSDLPDGNFVINSEGMMLGRDALRTDRLFDGLMADVGMWSGMALSHEELAVIGALGRSGFPLSSTGEIAALLDLYTQKTGSVQTGLWQWTYTADMPEPADGLGLALGKHFAAEGGIYVVLGGNDGAWEGLVAEAVEIEGGYDSWVASHFDAGEAGDPMISGPEAAPAGDGVPNLLKYAFGMDPKQPAPRGDLPVANLAGDALMLTFTRAKNVSDADIVFEWSENLEVWQSANGMIEEINVEDRGETERVTVRAAGLPGDFSRAFLRLSAELVEE